MIPKPRLVKIGNDKVKLIIFKLPGMQPGRRYCPIKYLEIAYDRYFTVDVNVRVEVHIPRFGIHDIVLLNTDDTTVIVEKMIYKIC